MSDSDLPEMQKVRNVEYKFQFGTDFERIHISGNQISWLGARVHQIRTAFEVMDRAFSETDDTEIQNERLESLVNFVCQTYEVKVHPTIYFTETEIVRVAE